MPQATECIGRLLRPPAVRLDDPNDQVDRKSDRKEENRSNDDQHPLRDLRVVGLATCILGHHIQNRTFAPRFRRRRESDDRGSFFHTLIISRGSSLQPQTPNPKPQSRVSYPIPIPFKAIVRGSSSVFRPASNPTAGGRSLRPLAILSFGLSVGRGLPPAVGF